MGMLKKHVASCGGKPTSGSLLPHLALSGHPASWEFLSETVWAEDGTRREPGTVLVFCDAVGLKVMLNDKDGHRVAFAVVGPEDSVLDTVEGMLLSTATDWRAAKSASSTNRK